MSDYCKKCGKKLIEKKVRPSWFSLWLFNLFSFHQKIGLYNQKTGEENEFFELQCPDYKDSILNSHTILSRVTTNF